MIGNPMIELRNIWVRYADVAVLEGVDLSVRSRDFLGIIGPNGGGKSTLLKVILGLVVPDEGVVRVLGEPPERSRRSIGYVAQRLVFDRDFPVSVLDVVLMGRHRVRGMVRRYDATDVRAAEHALERVGMRGAQRRQIGRLSGGEQQRMFIARALVGEPQILLLDEPLASVDPAMQTDLYELLEELHHTFTVVMVSHDIGAISIYVDTIACLNRKLHYHGSAELSPEVLEATYQCPVQLIAHGPVPHRVLKEH